MLSNLDGGAYQLVYVDTPDFQRRYVRDGVRIQHFAKTITVP
jgi:hypothetical protein